MALELLAFHGRTNHTPVSVRAGSRGLDWANQPWPFKEYGDLPVIRLPAEREDTKVPALKALRGAKPTEKAGRLSLHDLAHLLYYSAGVTRVRSGGGQPFHFRAYACAGALYPIEVYLIAGDMADLPAGVYHFHPGEFSLRPLRGGDHRGDLLAAVAGDAALATAPAALVLAGIYWRTMWKYEARGYRHLYWDSGMVLANLFAVTAAMGIPTNLILGFVDSEVDRLLGLDGRHEVSLAIIAMGEGMAVPARSAAVLAIDPEVNPLSRREIEYADAHTAHDVSRFQSASDVEVRRRARYRARPAGGPGIKLTPLQEVPAEPVERVILRRGSTRRFTDESIRFDQLSTILEVVSDAAINQVYLLVSAVDGLQPGAYFLDAEAKELVLLKAGAFREAAGYLCLEQPLLAQAAAVIFLMADLQAVLDAMGPRGYRAALLEAGVLGGRIYLGAYALQIGATGSTFYDEEVTGFFSPDADGKSPMLAIGVGRDARRFRDRS
ncbi:MAG TPA: SagB/ThcOx family dehydrogenase [Candidatus Dormibacteraeota bacterium]|jgi:SagB-type dehydrogenase family enzyme